MPLSVRFAFVRSFSKLTSYNYSVHATRTHNYVAPVGFNAPRPAKKHTRAIAAPYDLRASTVTMQCSCTIYVPDIEQRRHQQGETTSLDVNTSLDEHGIMRSVQEDNVALSKPRPPQNAFLRALRAAQFWHVESPADKSVVEALCLLCLVKVADQHTRQHGTLKALSILYHA
jgi:hypothetical protein